MARLRESDETRAATPFSRPSLWPQRVHLPTPFSSTSSPAQRRSALLALSGRRETPDCVTCRGELQAAGLPTHGSSGRRRPLFEHRNGRASACALSPPGAGSGVGASAAPHSSGTLHLLEEKSFSSSKCARPPPPGYVVGAPASTLRPQHCAVAAVPGRLGACALPFVRGKRVAGLGEGENSAAPKPPDLGRRLRSDQGRPHTRGRCAAGPGE